ncbi:sugar phosphate isomerase/epimerase [Halobacillus shinanisalinarum]|uniref:Sugar phosphate isomerase/epimerase n=1 Tax=Halobacillus shinanisalinarum TaxID=2932258 RepID=A0ABY4H6W0_9BACI|nr:sugar phosphate isomerase/epimerase [Halobacillus shinanisalinarum]UOQ95790.1 sugar phosphate isomerase/epimerase [Halobacillus shinanisalinarum]
MKTGLVTDILSYMPFEKMLDTCKELGIETIELGCGNWSNAPHLDLDGLLDSSYQRRQFLETIESRGLEISALNCSGNQLEPTEQGEKHAEVVEKTFKLAGLLGVKTVVMMSGCPSARPEDRVPNWITHPILPPHFETLDWQWNEVAFPYWERAVKVAKDSGVEKIAIENLGFNLVHNPETLLKLRNEVGEMVGMNLDPSHLFWMGGDPIAAARTLGNAIHHVHAKDVRIERGVNDVNGLIDVKPMESFADRSWNYVALGYGHSVKYWKEFFTVVKMMGYEGAIVLEMEDLTMDPLTGVKKSMDVLRDSLPRDFKKAKSGFVSRVARD